MPQRKTILLSQCNTGKWLFRCLKYLFFFVFNSKMLFRAPLLLFKYLIFICSSQNVKLLVSDYRYYLFCLKKKKKNKICAKILEKCSKRAQCKVVIFRFLALFSFSFFFFFKFIFILHRTFAINRQITRLCKTIIRKEAKENHCIFQNNESDNRLL